MYSHINPTTNLSRESISTRLEPYEKKSFIKSNEIDFNPILKKSKITLEEKKPLNNVIVLADNKNYSRDFLKSLGMTIGLPYLCTIHIPTKMFTFQIYGLEESDEKIFSHVKTNAGLVIITTAENYSKLFERIKFYTSNISHIPILIVIEGMIKPEQIEKISKISKANVRYEFEKPEKISKFIRYESGYQTQSQTQTQTQTQTQSLTSNLEWFNSNVTTYKPIPKDLLGLEELVKQFVNCELSIENWSHFNRLRIVYFSLKNFGYEKTIDQTGWLCINWNKYKNTIGHSHLWNYTLTKLWMDQIFSLMLKNPKMDFAQLYSEYDYLSDGNLHKKYYSNEVLFSDKARKEWVEPNLIIN